MTAVGQGLEQGLCPQFLRYYTIQFDGHNQEPIIGRIFFLMSYLYARRE